MSTQALSAPKPNTALVTVDAAKKFLTDPTTQAEINRGLSKHMTADRMCRLALTAVQKNPKLLECFATSAGKRSIALAMLTAGQIGLEIDGRHAHLVPFKNKAGYMEAVFMADYKGLIKLAHNHPNVLSIWADEVRKNDHFIFSRGTAPKIEHLISLDQDRGDLIGAYACCELRDSKMPVFVVLALTDIDRIKSSSRGANDDNSPWQTAPGEMFKKSALRQLSKVIPQSAELQKALSTEDEFEDTGRTASSLTIDVQPQPEVRFQKTIATEAPTEQQVAGATAGAEQEATQPEQQQETSTKEKRKNPSVDLPQTDAGEPEPSLAEQIAKFYSDETAGVAGFVQVMATMGRMKPSFIADEPAKTFAELSEAKQKSLWGGRHGLVRAVREDLKKTTAQPQQ